MIVFLLLLLQLAAAATVIYVVGRLLYDIVRLFIDRNQRDEADKGAFWRDVGAIGIAAQIVALAAIGAIGAYLWSNFRTRADDIGLKLSFDFLDRPGNISMADNSLEPADTVEEAITAGIGNTIRIILVGIPLALILGTLVGIARFSSNWLVRKLATAYVEFFRNIPVLVVIVFFWGGAFLKFPRSQEAWKPLAKVDRSGVIP